MKKSTKIKAINNKSYKEYLRKEMALFTKSMLKQIINKGGK